MKITICDFAKASRSYFFKSEERGKTIPMNATKLHSFKKTKLRVKMNVFTTHFFNIFMRIKI